MKKILFFTALIFISVTVEAQKNNSKKSEQKYYDIFRCSDIYNSVWRELDINYVDTLNHEKLNDIAINSMLQSLDPYTVYIPEQQEEDLKAMTTGIYGGIGAVVQKHNDYVVISEPRYGLTAYKNGILAGDEIVSIDNENMKGKTVSYVSNKLKGIPGSEIKLKLRRHGENKPIEKTFRREAIHINSIDYYGVVADSIGYIALTDFTDQSYNDFKVALTTLKDKNIKRLIIDLRNKIQNSVRAYYARYSIGNHSKRKFGFSFGNTCRSFSRPRQSRNRRGKELRERTCTGYQTVTLWRISKSNYRKILFTIRQMHTIY